MARNRRQIPREQRAGEITTAAAELFLKQGYASTTMADISERVGATPANVYWYFASKDDLFAAVMDRMLSREILALDHEMRDYDPLTKLVQGLGDLRPYRELHQAMHHRMAKSKAVREAHDRFLDWIRGMVRQILAEREADDPEMIVDTVLCLFEGSNVLEPPPRTAPDMIRHLLQHVTTEPATP